MAPDKLAGSQGDASGSQRLHVLGSWRFCRHPALAVEGAELLACGVSQVSNARGSPGARTDAELRLQRVESAVASYRAYEEAVPNWIAAACMMNDKGGRTHEEYTDGRRHRAGARHRLRHGPEQVREDRLRQHVQR